MSTNFIAFLVHIVVNAHATNDEDVRIAVVSYENKTHIYGNDNIIFYHILVLAYFLKYLSYSHENSPRNKFSQ